MPPVFAHGRLRLYLLKLLDESPRHGYEVIRLLEERFQGLYAPSAGTVYPRLAKLEAEGLVTHTSEGGRKVYALTDAGRAELAGRGGELDDLEREIRESVAGLAAEIREDVRGAAGRVRSELRAAASRARTAEGATAAEAAFAEAREEWKEQARRARAEARSAKLQAKEFQRIAQQVQEEVQSRFTRGDWPQAVWEGVSGITAQLGGLVSGAGHPKAAGAEAPREAPEWARPGETSDDPARDLDRLLDRFRDGIRDAARDHGVTEAQLAEAREHLATAAARITEMLTTRKHP